MAGQDRRRRSRSGRLLDASLWGAVLGAGAGAVLGDAIEGVGAGAGALIGAALYAPAELISALRRRPAEPAPLAQRIVSSALLMAVFGWVLGLVLGSGEPLIVAMISGAVIGVLGLRPAKAALGLVVGAVLGAALTALQDPPEPALVAAAVTIAYRAIAATVYRGRPLVRIMAEEVPAAELRYVVPFEARSRYVGADYVEQLAHVRGGTFRRNPPDVGIVASLDALEGPTFAPARVHALIREFYEHTSRFKLSIVPEWRRWMKPGYEVFKRLVAEPLGQAAIPSNIEEAQRGMVSTIDTIDLDGDEEIDIRGLDPDVRGLGAADLRRHLHDVPPRGPRLRERGLPDPERELHRHAAAAQRRRARLAPDVAHQPRVPRPLPELRRQRPRRAHGCEAARLRGGDRRLRHRRRAADRAQLLARGRALPNPALRDRADRRDRQTASRS